MTDRDRRVLITDDGPLLIHGPIDVELPDGSRVRSDRAVTALCVCGRSRRRPFCDTSHRPRARRAESDPAESDPAVSDPTESDQ
ncbi:MAG: CDGSH iron-sulfur domain-containing protein [Pseudonocardia sp.]